MALKTAKIITVTSVKGGTGKTTFTLNLAGLLSLKQKKTIIVDLDLHLGAIAPSLNLDKSNSDIYTMCDDMLNNRFSNIDDYIQKYNEYLDVIAAPLDPRSVTKIKTSYIENILSRLMLKYDYVLIDTNHILNQMNLVVLDRSDEVYYIMTNDLIDIKGMKTMISIFKDMNLEKYKIVLNMARLNNTGYSEYEIESTIDSKIDYIIPRSFFCRNIEKYVFDGKIMTLDKNILNNKCLNTFKEIVDNLIKE